MCIITYFFSYLHLKILIYLHTIDVFTKQQPELSIKIATPAILIG